MSRSLHVIEIWIIALICRPNQLCKWNKNSMTPNHTTWVALPMAELQEAKSGIAQGDMFWDKCGRGTVPIQETQSLSTLSLDLTPYLCRLGRVGETVPEDYGL